MNDAVKVVGAGLAGCEAAWQLLRRNIPVRLTEMKPTKFSPAHHSAGFAELVCSNSLKAEHLTNASGVLKAEMQRLDSLVLRAAHHARVPAGGALAVDRDKFSEYITDALMNHPMLTVERKVVDELPEGPVIIATGPLTDGGLADNIVKLNGSKTLHFFDAAAPVVSADSVDMEIAFRASRYGRGEDDYINCPMDQAQYDAFYDAVMGAELAQLHDFESDKVFEGCLAVEILASRGRQTLAFGPLKPIGLTDPRTGKMPYAVVQLRQDNDAGTLYNMVGFQTRLKWGEQKRVFSMIPGLEHAEFLRYGVMHRNTYLNGPDVLSKNYAWNRNPLVRFAGQMTGVEGYMESASSGLIAGLSLARVLLGQAEIEFPDTTVIGALERYVRTPQADFQPMNANFGLIRPLETRIRNKKQRYEQLAARAVEEIEKIVMEVEENK